MPKSAVRLLLLAAWCVAQLTACGATQQPGSLTPMSAARQRPPSPIVGVYVSQTSGMNVLEYQYQGTGNPLCTLNLGAGVYSIQSDVKNELIVPTSAAVNVYKEHKDLCLSSLPSKQFTQTGGEDGISLDGVTYYIAAASSIVVCKWGPAPSCPRLLTHAPAYAYYGVTANSTGVYAAGLDNGKAVLVYWAGGKGKGQILQGFVNGMPGGVYFDGFGNLLSIDPGNPDTGGSNLYVYSGCPSACVAHGPFSLGVDSEVVYASLGNGETTFMALNTSPITGDSIDVYQYDGIDGITYKYSNTAGLQSANNPAGIAQLLD